MAKLPNPPRTAAPRLYADILDQLDRQRRVRDEALLRGMSNPRVPAP